MQGAFEILDRIRVFVSLVFLLATQEEIEGGLGAGALGAAELSGLAVAIILESQASTPSSGGMRVRVLFQRSLGTFENGEGTGNCPLSWAATASERTRSSS